MTVFTNAINDATEHPFLVFTPTPDAVMIAELNNSAVISQLMVALGEGLSETIFTVNIEDAKEVTTEFTYSWNTPENILNVSVPILISESKSSIYALISVKVDATIDVSFWNFISDFELTNKQLFEEIRFSTIDSQVPYVPVFDHTQTRAEELVSKYNEQVFKALAEEFDETLVAKHLTLDASHVAAYDAPGNNEEAFYLNVLCDGKLSKVQAELSFYKGYAAGNPFIKFAIDEAASTGSPERMAMRFDALV